MSGISDAGVALLHKRTLIAAVLFVLALLFCLAEISGIDGERDTYSICQIRETAESSIALSQIEQYMLDHLANQQSSYNATHNLQQYGLKLGNFSMKTYASELLKAVDVYLPSPQPYLHALESRLSMDASPANLPKRPKQIITTDKSRDSLPEEFERWTEIMPDWEIRYFDDNALVQWIEDHFGGSKAEKIWKALPRQAMLVEGGIYTDSDTAPITHADLWGHPYEKLTDPLLDQVSKVLQLSKPPAVSSIIPPDDSPSLVISVESDAVEFGWDNWRDIGLSRTVQITQWTFMARPGHPVMLDATLRVLAKSEHMAQKAETLGSAFIPESALEWSGPAVLTDCVYRYLLARYGFHPEQLIHRKSPVRVGDVLILPAGSFSSVSPFTGEPQRKWAASWHGFYGRWRGSDPGVQESERLKKLREDAEAAELSEPN